MKGIICSMVVFAVFSSIACSPSATSVPVNTAEELNERKAFKDVAPTEASVGTAAQGVQFIDVRGEAEFEARHAPNSVNIPMSKLGEAAKDLDSSKPTYVICEVGLRSEDAAGQLAATGFTDVRHVKGGISAWVKAGLPVAQE